MKTDGNIVTDTKISSDRMRRGIPEIKGFMTELGGIMKDVGKVIITTSTIKQIVQFGKECLELGSDLAEVRNAVDMTFPSMTE